VVLVLDTATVPTEERADAVAAALLQAGITAEIIHLHADRPINVKVGVWDLGGGARLLRRTSSGIRLSQSLRQAHRADTERVSLSVLSPGGWHFTQDTAEFVGTPRHGMVLTDHSTAYEFERDDVGATIALNVDRTTLGLSVETIRTAVGRLPASPLYELLLRHLLLFGRNLETIEQGPALAMVGSGTTDLLRALICSVGDSPQLQRSALADSLLARVEAFILAHLTDSSLTPAAIAAAHSISLRQLYVVWAGHDQSLAQWIVHQRLERARRELAAPQARHRTIAAIARGVGFSDAAHFAYRFRETYGLSPRDWRQLRQPTP
jgi:AraC-like DNA-binding protein